MAKSKIEKQKAMPAAKRAGKTKKGTKDQATAAEHVNNLLKLHKLQGVLLERLKKEV